MRVTLLHYPPIPSVLRGCTVANSTASYFLPLPLCFDSFFKVQHHPSSLTCFSLFPGSLTVSVPLPKSLDVCQIWGISRKAHSDFSLVGVAWQSLKVKFFTVWLAKDFC